MADTPQDQAPHVDPVRWIRARLQMQTVWEEGGKWKARFQAKELGEFASQSAALKAYRKAAEERFHEGAVLPSEQEIDQAGQVEVPKRPEPRQPPQRAPQQRQQPTPPPPPPPPPVSGRRR